MTCENDNRDENDSNNRHSNSHSPTNSHTHSPPHSHSSPLSHSQSQSRSHPQSQCQCESPIILNGIAVSKAVQDLEILMQAQDCLNSDQKKSSGSILSVLDTEVYGRASQASLRERERLADRERERVVERGRESSVFELQAEGCLRLGSVKEDNTHTNTNTTSSTSPHISTNTSPHTHPTNTNTNTNTSTYTSNYNLPPGSISSPAGFGSSSLRNSRSPKSIPSTHTQTHTPIIYLLSQSSGFMVKNKFVSEEQLIPMLIPSNFDSQL